MVTAADGVVETGGLRMACQSAGKPLRRHHQYNVKVKELLNRRRIKTYRKPSCHGIKAHMYSMHEIRGHSDRC